MASSVSVIIPTFNRRTLLARAVDSALAQTHAAVEVIVVDDGSTDGTADMMRHRYGNDARVHLIRQENRGVCVARNRALDAAQGAFIAFLDSDDVWRPWKLEVQLACLMRRPELGMVWTDMAAVGPDGAILHERFLRRMYTTYRWFPDSALFDTVETLGAIMPDCPVDLAGALVSQGRIGPMMIIGNLVHTSTILLTRSRLELVGRFDETLVPAGEDHDFHLRTCAAGRVGLIDVASIAYQTGLSDRLTRHREAMARNYLITLDRAIARTRPVDRPSAHDIRRARGRGHAWLAGIMMEQGDKAGARGHLLRSLRHDPLQPRQIAELIGAGLPKPVYDGVRALLGRGRANKRAAKASMIE